MLLRQTVAVEYDENEKKSSWFARRSGLEYGLAVLCLTLLGALIVVLAALAQDTAPLEPDWGNYAEWAGAIVTFGGFVGATAAVIFQGRALRIQQDQYDRESARRLRQEADDRDTREQEERQALERWADAVSFAVHATHSSELRGHHLARDGQLRIEVSVIPPKGQKIRDVLLGVPTVEWLKTEEDATECAVLDGSIGRSMRWRARAQREQFDGDDVQAQEWCDKYFTLDFTDSKDVRWRKFVNGSFKKLQ